MARQVLWSRFEQRLTSQCVGRQSFQASYASAIVVQFRYPPWDDHETQASVARLSNCDRQHYIQSGSCLSLENTRPLLSVRLTWQKFPRT